MAWWREVDGSEGSTVTITYTGTAQSMFATSYEIIDWNKAVCKIGFPNGLLHAATTTTSATADPPNLAPGIGAYRPGLWFGGLCARDSSDLSPAPDGYSNLQAQRSSNFAFASFERRLKAASEDPGSIAMTSDVWAGVTICVPN